MIWPKSKKPQKIRDSKATDLNVPAYLLGVQGPSMGT